MSWHLFVPCASHLEAGMFHVSNSESSKQSEFWILIAEYACDFSGCIDFEEQSGSPLQNQTTQELQCTLSIQVQSPSRNLGIWNIFPTCLGSSTKPPRFWHRGASHFVVKTSRIIISISLILRRGFLANSQDNVWVQARRRAQKHKHIHSAGLAIGGTLLVLGRPKGNNQLDIFLLCQAAAPQGTTVTWAVFSPCGWWKNAIACYSARSDAKPWRTALHKQRLRKGSCR